MKMNKYLTLPLIAAGLSVSVAGIAASNDSSSHQERSQALFKKLDTNNDGKLSAAEMTKLPDAMRQQRFDRLDTNGDGKIDKDEYEASFTKRADRMFQHLDKNGDGSVSADEMKTAAQHWHDKKGKSESQAGNGKKAMGHHHHRGHHHRGMMPRTDYLFAHMDKDNDGYVSADEWNKAAQKWQARHHFKKPVSSAGKTE